MQDGFTPEEQQRLADLQAQMNLNCRYTPPPLEEADEWVPGFMDLDHENATIYGIKFWMPKAIVEAWECLRFRGYPEVWN
jgi:hypothetical protein